jgi:hypothetical protein
MVEKEEAGMGIVSEAVIGKMYFSLYVDMIV